MCIRDRVTVDQNLHPYVNIEVKDRVLTIAFKGAKVDHFTKFIVKTNSKWLAAAKVSGNATFMVNSPLTGAETVIKAHANSSVSYTPLDVYKRQALYPMNTCFKRSPIILYNPNRSREDIRSP